MVIIVVSLIVMRMTIVFVINILLGGWELAYDYFMHVTGKQEKFSGVQMHVGHYRDAMDERIQACNPGVAGFFSPRKWRIFLHSSLALRMASLPATTREPCCDLSVIGGDGTGIGVPLKNALHVQPAWAPPEEGFQCSDRDSTMNRCAIGPTDMTGTASEIANARKFLKDITSRSISVSQKGALRDSISEFGDYIPQPILSALVQFLILDESEKHWRDIRSILHVLSYKESLTGVIPVRMLPDIKQVILRMRLQGDCTSDGGLFDRLSRHGFGPEISRILQIETEKSHSQHPPTQTSLSKALANLFEYIGNSPFAVFDIPMYLLKCNSTFVCELALINLCVRVMHLKVMNHIFFSSRFCA